MGPDNDSKYIQSPPSSRQLHELWSISPFASPNAVYPPTVIETTARGERAFDIFSRLLRERIVFMGTAIDDTVANFSCCFWKAKTRKKIYVCISILQVVLSPPVWRFLIPCSIFDRTCRLYAWGRPPVWEPFSCVPVPRARDFPCLIRASLSTNRLVERKVRPPISRSRLARS